MATTPGGFGKSLTIIILIFGMGISLLIAVCITVQCHPKPMLTYFEGLSDSENDVTCESDEDSD